MKRATDERHENKVRIAMSHAASKYFFKAFISPMFMLPMRTTSYAKENMMAPITGFVL